MAKRLFKWFYKTIEFLTGFLIILLLMLLLRLWVEPLQIKNLTPLIVQAMVPADSDMEVKIDNAYVELALSRGRLLDVHLQQLTISSGDTFILNVENANVSFNPLSLLIGKVVVRDIFLQKPYVQLDLAPKESDALVADKKRPIERKLNRLRRHFENLDLLHIQDGELVLKFDADKDLIMPDMDILFERQDDETIQLSATGMLYFDSTFMNVGIQGSYLIPQKICDLNAVAKQVEVKKLQELLPSLKAVDLVLDAQVDIQLDLKNLKKGWRDTFEKVSFEAASAQAGTIYLPEPLNTTYPIEQLVMRGNISKGLQQILIENSSVQILGQEALVQVTLDNLDKFIQTKDFSQTATQLEVSLHQISLNEVPHLWPAYLGTPAHTWIKQNVSGGMITKATLNLEMQGVEIKNLTSVLDVENAKVQYLETMTPIEKVKAQVVLKTNRIDIHVLDGVCGGVRATGGFVNFLDLDKDIPSFDAHVQLSGSVLNALKVVSGEPLGVCEAMPVSCQGIKGNANGELQLAFPFSQTLENEIKFNVLADLEDVSMPVPQTNWTFQNGIMKLFVNNQKLSLSGKGQIDDKPVQVDVLQSLEDENAGTYQFKLPVSPSMITPYFADIDDFLKGNLMADITVIPHGRGQRVALDFGLKDAEITLPIGYTKEFNQDGTLKATLSIQNQKLKDISSLYLSIPEENITIKGRVNLPKDKLFELDLTEIKAPHTDAHLVLGIYERGGFDAVVTGKSLQIKDLIHGSFFNRQRSESEVKAALEKEPQDFLIIGKVDKLYLSDTEPFTNVDVIFKKSKGHWSELKGTFTGKVPFTFSLNADKTALHVSTKDVGTFLHRAGYTDRISGGVLDTTLAQEKDGTLKGEILINDFKLTKTSFFMQAATLLGIVDALSGDYISFAKAVIPFTLSPANVVSIEDAVAYGTAVGITMRGTMSSEKIKLEGSVVPAYALNSLFGKIPVVGTLLTGEKGGGLFGVTYSVTGKPSTAEFNFNPASILAPGIFRRLF